MSSQFLQKLILLVCAVSTAKSLDATLSLRYSNNTFPGLEGSTAFMECAWTLAAGDIPGALTFRSANRGDIFTFTIGSIFGSDIARSDGWVDGRMETSPVDSTSSSVTFSLRNLECADEDTYTCNIPYSTNGESQTPIVRQQTLTLKVPPLSPTVVILSEDPSGGLLEQSQVRVSCSASTGSADKGGLHWRIFRRDQIENINVADGDLTTSNLGAPDQCKETLQTTLNLRVNRTDQELVITCFVSNEDFAPLSSLPVACEDTSLCDQTQRIRIHYPVEERTLFVTHEPQQVYQGGSVTLSCQADGFPEASISWSKGNETLVGEADGFGGSKLVLSNLTVDEDSGVYNCTATNTVKDTLYSVSKEVNIDVSSTPPPVTQRPTTQPPTTDPNGNEPDKSTSGGGGDDTVIIVVIVIVVVLVIIVAVVAVVLYKRRKDKKTVDEPPRKPVSNASNNLAFVNGSQPDLVADDKYRMPSLNNSFDIKNEDGLMYANLTYDNRPRSRKPLAIGDNASDYSDIQMPQV